MTASRHRSLTWQQEINGLLRAWLPRAQSNRGKQLLRRRADKQTAAALEAVRRLQRALPLLLGLSSKAVRWAGCLAEIETALQAVPPASVRRPRGRPSADPLPLVEIRSVVKRHDIGEAEAARYIVAQLWHLSDDVARSVLISHELHRSSDGVAARKEAEKRLADRLRKLKSPARK